jgi:acetamidase/formamidase
MARTHSLDAETIHREWNNTIPPRLEIDPGDTVHFETRDAANRYYTPTSSAEDVLKRGPFVGHPLTGPVFVKGAQPGDTLVVEILETRSSLGWGWTQIRPGRGLLPEADFPKPYLQIWDLSDGKSARMGHGIIVPIEAFPGVVGVALEEPGAHSTMPPRRNGGNMDIKQLTAGTTLYLPVLVDGALVSTGDAHAAQGDGEVCITAIEMSADVTLRFGVQRARRIAEPRFRTAGPIGVGTNRGPHFVTTAHGPDLFGSSQQAIRYMIEHLVESRGLSPEQAYVLCSVAVDLRISEIVDAPNWIVSAFLPESVFE